MNPSYGATNRAPAFGGAGGFGAGRFGGFGRGFFGGLLGAGLFGLLFGHSFFGGFGGPFSLIGFLIQIGILFFLFRLAMRWFQGPQMRFAGGYGASPAGGYASSYASAAPASSGGGQPISLTGDDYNAFEWLLQESQLAFGAEDMERLRRVATPEMASYFAEQLAQEARRGVVNKLADVRLLKGDLSEAWADGTGEYATVAMRFSLLDWTVERDSGRLVDGDPQHPQEIAEVWTFRRDLGEHAQGWRISAIQQAQ
jgi:predicted lipid-binding transport protein (Tim44 family)